MKTMQRSGWVLLALAAAALAASSASAEPQGIWSFAPEKGRAPGPRYQYSMVSYQGDPIVYGGTKGNLRSGAELNDMWRFKTSLGIWEELVSVNGQYPRGIGRWGASLTVHGDLLVLFAGCNTQTYLNDIWVYDMIGRTWTEHVDLSGLPRPMPRQAFGTVRRTGMSDTLYIMGGIGLYESLRDMWTLDLNTFAFTQLHFNNSVYLGDDHESPQWTGGKGVTTRYRPSHDSIIAAFGSPQLPNEEVNVAYTSEFSFANMNWTRLETLSVDADGELPEPRNLAASVLYNDKLFVFGGWSDIMQEGPNRTYALDLHTLQWEQLEHRGDPDPRDSMNFVMLSEPPAELLEVEPTVKHAAFFFGGWGDAISNDVFYFDTDNTTWYKAHEMLVLPTPRSAHAAAVHGHEMVLHGGADAQGNIFNELWVLETRDGTWRQISPPGAQPSARHSHGACMIGDEFYIFGGVTAAGLVDDTWHYSFVANTWRQITYVQDDANPVDPPAARRNMGLASSNLFMYVVAGKGTVDLYNDVMELDTVTGMWRVVSPTVGHDPITDEQPADYPEPRFQFGFGVFLYPIPFGADVTLYNVNITAPLVDEAFVLWGGLSNTATQLNDIWLFRLSNASWSSAYPTELRARSLVGSVTQGQHKFISTGGQIYEDMVNELTLFTFQDGEHGMSSKENGNLTISHLAVDPNTATGRTPPPLASHSTVVIGSQIYTFGGFSSLPPDVSTTTTVVPALTLNQVYVFTLSPLCPIGELAENATTTMQEEADDCFMCAPGSMAALDDDTGNVTCPLCAPGRYSSFFGATQCTLCAPGFYSALEGASSPVSCVACETGTYNNITGASACLTCPAGANCPAATITPTFGTLGAQAINGQPQPLQSLTQERLDKQNSVLYGALGNIGLAILVICVIIKINHEDALKDFDMYPREHRPLCQEHRIMKEWKTSLGGMFSVCGIIFVLYFIVIQSLDWLDAVRETRSLIPNLSAPEGLVTEAAFTVQLSFQNYGDNCVDQTAPVGASGRRTKCVRSIGFQTAALTIGSTDLSCLYDSGTSGLPVCNVTWMCYKCNLTQAVGSVGFTLDQPLSYATSIVWNFTTSSGVPPDQSSFYQSAISSDPGRSFRGATPTVVNLQMTRTLFEDRTGSDPEGSGYQIEFLTNTTGSQVSAALFQYARGLGFRFDLKRSETTFEIVRESILTTATFIASLLGGVSGVLAGIGALLSIAERAQLYVANKKALAYTNELGRKMLPENLPLEGKKFERQDWVIASLFAPVAARLASWEAEAEYVPPKEALPPPPRSFVTWELLLVLLVELGTYSIPARIFSSVTDDADGNENTYATTILLDWFRALFFMWISSRLTGNAGFSQHYFKFDKLMARAILYSITYIGMLLPSGASAGQSLAVVSEFLANVALMGHTRVLQRFHVWTTTTLGVYKVVRLYAPIMFACTSGSYVVARADSRVHKDLVVLWLLIGIDFYNEAFVHVCAFIIRRKKTKAELAAINKRREIREKKKSLLKRDSLDAAAGERLVAAHGTPFLGQKRLSSHGSSAGPQPAPAGGVPPTPGSPAAPITPMTPGSPSLEPTSPLARASLPLSPAQVKELHAGRHSRSQSASSFEPPARVSVSDHVGHDPAHQETAQDDLGVPALLFWIAVVVEILSSLGPIGRVYDDTHQAGDTTVTNVYGNVTTVVTDTQIDAGDKGYLNGLAATVVLSWARTIFWTFMALKLVKWDRRVFFGYVTTLDFLTARVLIMQIAYTVNLFDVNRGSTAWLLLVTDWVMAITFNAYIRIMFKCIKWHSSTLLSLYKAQRFIAPIVCLSVGIAILAFPLYDTQPETYLFYLVCAILYFADIVMRYWHTPALDDPVAMANSPSGYRPGSKEAKAAALKAKQLESFDPRDTRPKAPLTHPMPQWLFALTVLVEILSSSGPVFRIVAEDSSESGNHDAQINSLVSTAVLAWARTALWLYCSERQRQAAMWDDYLVLDNLTLGAILQTIAYGSLSVRAYPTTGWVPINIISDILMAWVLAGHVRIMCKYYTWDYSNLFVYRLQRLYSPALWILVGVMYQWKASDSNTKADFVLYLICGTAFLFDLYSRTTKIKDVKPKTPEQREMERVAAFVREKEARLAARKIVAGDTSSPSGGAALSPNGADAASNTTAAGAEVTVIELPTMEQVQAQARGSRMHLQAQAQARRTPTGSVDGRGTAGSMSAAAAPPATLDMSAATRTPTSGAPTVTPVVQPIALEPSPAMPLRSVPEASRPSVAGAATLVPPPVMLTPPPAFTPSAPATEDSKQQRH